MQLHKTLSSFTACLYKSEFIMDSYSLKLRERLNIIFKPRQNFDMTVSIKPAIRLNESPSTGRSNAVHLKKTEVAPFEFKPIIFRVIQKTRIFCLSSQYFGIFNVSLTLFGEIQKSNLPSVFIFLVLLLCIIFYKNEKRIHDHIFQSNSSL